MPSPFIWTMAELSKNRRFSFFFFFSLSLFFYIGSKRCIVRFALLPFDYCARSSSQCERERKKKKEWTMSKREREERRTSTYDRIGFNSPDRYLNRWNKCACACISFARSPFPLSLSFSIMHTRTSVIFFLFEIVFSSCLGKHRKVCVCVCEREKFEDFDVRSANITKDWKKPENSISEKNKQQTIWRHFLLYVETNE